MKRLEFLGTQKGQKRLWFERGMSRLFIEVTGKLSSKNMSYEKKINFQKHILESMRKNKRRAYRSNLVLELEFLLSSNNHPSIHRLAKNYLDLLEKPLDKKITSHKRILYENDRQIKMLFVQCYKTRKEKEGIRIKVDTLSNFIKDLELLDRIHNNTFIADGELFSRDADISSFEIDGEKRIDYSDEFSFDFNVEQLKELRDNKKIYVSKYGLKKYRMIEATHQLFIQEHILNHRQLSTSQLLFLLSTFLQGSKDYFSKYGSFAIRDYFDNLRKEIILSPSFSVLDLMEAPSYKLRTKDFTKRIENILLKFKKQHQILFPLRCSLGLLIFYVPPKNQPANQVIDLDNLATNIIKAVHRIMEPPFAFPFSMKSHDKRIISLTKYQIIQLPNHKNDPKEGYIRLIFEHGYSFENVWGKIEEPIYRWEDML